MTDNTPFRIAGAPISWGVCEVPGWGYQLGPDKVLAEMREVGLVATELGPDGFLPAEPDAMATVLAQHGLQAVGGFTPLLLHVPDHDPVPEVERILEGYVASNASTLVLSSVSGQDGYDSRPELDDKGWQTLLDNLSRISGVAAAQGIRAVLHPHVGTMIENTAEVQRVLDGSSIDLCLDTGHLLIGGTDPAELTRQAPERVAHVHFKDVDASKAKHVQDGRWTYTEGVTRGMYRPLGTGDVDVAAIVEHLTKRGYDGWYTLEQDTILADEPTGEGPVADVRTSADNLRAVLREHGMTSTAVEPLRVGILGAARIAELAIVKPAHATGTRLVTVAARSQSRAEAFAAEHGVERATDSYAAVLADPEVEAVYNPLPNAMHGPWNLAAIAAGKHVLSEKPFASTAEEAAEVRDAAEKAGVTVVEGFHYLYHPVTERLFGLLDSGELGELQRVEALVAMPPPDDGDLRWSFDLAGGSLMDLGCYGLHAHRHLGRFAGGEPELVGARAQERAGSPGVDEWLEADLRFPSGATGWVRSSMVHPHFEMTLRVVGTRGDAVALDFVNPHKDAGVVVRTEDGTRTEDLADASSYVFQLQAFTAAVRGGTPMPTGPDDAVATAELIDQCYRAAGLPLRPRATLADGRS